MMAERLRPAIVAIHIWLPASDVVTLCNVSTMLLGLVCDSPILPFSVSFIPFMYQSSVDGIPPPTVHMTLSVFPSIMLKVPDGLVVIVRSGTLTVMEKASRNS